MDDLELDIKWGTGSKGLWYYWCEGCNVLFGRKLGSDSAKCYLCSQDAVPALVIYPHLIRKYIRKAKRRGIVDRDMDINVAKEGDGGSHNDIAHAEAATCNCSS